MPTINHLRLAFKLRDFRQRTGITQEEAATRARLSKRTVIRYEKCEIFPPPVHLRALAAVYGCSRQEDELLLDIRRKAKEPGWWVVSGSDKTHEATSRPWAELCLSMEMEASDITVVGGNLLPAMLQTLDYAAALDTFSTRDRSKVRERAELRVGRLSALLRRDKPPAVRMVMDESIFWKPTGGVEVMAAQMDHLLGLPDWIDLRVRPFAAPHIFAAMTTLYVIGGDVYGLGDWAMGANFVDDPHSLDTLTRGHGAAIDTALSRDDSLHFIERVAARYRSGEQGLSQVQQVSERR